MFWQRACGKTTDGEGVDATASARPTRLGALADSGKSRQVETVCGHPQHVCIGRSRDCGQRQAGVRFQDRREPVSLDCRHSLQPATHLYGAVFDTRGIRQRKLEKGVMKTLRRKTNWKFAELPKDHVGLCRVLLPSPIRSVAESDKAYELPSVMAGHRLTKDQEDYLEALSRLHRAIRGQGGSRAQEENSHSRDSPVSLPGERNERCRLGAVAGGGSNSGNTHPARRTKPDGVVHSKNLQTVQAIG